MSLIFPLSFILLFVVNLPASFMFAFAVLLLVVPGDMSYYGSLNEIAQKCIEFENGNCFDLDCGLVHSFKYCYQFQNTVCRNKNCSFLHCSRVEQIRYESTGKASVHLKGEVGRTLQSRNICGDFKKGVCKRAKCRLRHIKLEPLECNICTNNIILENFGALSCGHVLCMECALKILQHTNTYRTRYNEVMEIQCPNCKSMEEFKKLM